MVDIASMKQYFDSNIRKFLMKLEPYIILNFFLTWTDSEILYKLFYKEHVYEKHEAEINQNLRKI